MVCERLNLPGGGVAIVCSRGKRGPKARCQFCQESGRTTIRVAGLLCDGPSKKPGKTCDAKMCAGCATHLGADFDLCPRCMAAAPDEVAKDLTNVKRSFTSEGSGMGDITNDLTWSNSKSNNLAECPRKVWLAQFGSWGGWTNGDGDEESRRIYALKQMKGRHGWVGDLVHRAIEYTIGRYVDGDAATPEQVNLQFRRVMKVEYVASRDDNIIPMPKWQRNKLRPNEPKPVPLIEHHYDVKVSEAKWKELAEKMERCIGNFFDLPVFPSLVGAKMQPMGDEEWLSTEELESVEIAGIKAWVMADHVWRMVDGTIDVVDWKTGRAKQSDIEQVALYGLWASKKWGVPIESIQGRLVYLATGEERVVRCSKESVEAVELRVEADVADIRSRGLVVAANGNCTAPRERWPMTENARWCGWCEYQGICGR